MTARTPDRIGILHYSAPPVIGGVESVMHTHARFLVEAGYFTAILAGAGVRESLPEGVALTILPEIHSQHPQILEISHELEAGRVPAMFEEMVARFSEALSPLLAPFDLLIVHNVFTKHFNLPLTAALFRLLDQGIVRQCVAWCHDLTWTSPRSRSKVHPGYPWDLLRTPHADVTYVTISEDRQHELAGLFACPPEQIRVVYNGVEPAELLALSSEGLSLIGRLGLWESDLNVLLPVRVTQAKNIELAIRVAAALQEKDIHARMVVTGPPDPHDPASMDYFYSLLALREALDVREQVRFVYESGPVASQPYIVEMSVVAELFRMSDALFMPSHSEGFGMPILEAGLAGMPVFCSQQIPAANELGGQDVTRFSPQADPSEIAGSILKQMDSSSVFHLRRRVRKELTWHSIFHEKIQPLIEERSS
jgi:mannosylglucosylglycerate synthase